MRKRHAPRTRQGGRRSAPRAQRRRPEACPKHRKGGRSRARHSLASVAVIFAACGGSTASPSARRRAPRPPLRPPSPRPRQRRPSAAAFTGNAYPVDWRGPVRHAPDTPASSSRCRDRPADRRIPPVRPGRRVPAEGRVQRRSASRTADYARGACPGQVDPDPAERHRALQAQGSGIKGNRLILRGQPRLLGHQGHDAEARAPLEPTTPPSASSSSRPGTVDGIDNPGIEDIATIQGDSNLKFYPRDRA